MHCLICFLVKYGSWQKLKSKTVENEICLMSCRLDATKMVTLSNNNYPHLYRKINNASTEIMLALTLPLIITYNNAR